MHTYSQLDRLDVGVSCGRESERYFEFFAKTALALSARPDILRFVVAVNNGADRKFFEDLSNRFPIEIVEPLLPAADDPSIRALTGNIGARSYMHGLVLNAMAASFRSDYAVIADCDIAMVRKGWDELLFSKLTGDVVMVGSGYPRENAAQNISAKYRNFPNVTFCLLRAAKLREFAINFLPAGNVTLDAALAKNLGRKKGETVYLDVGAQLPVKFRAAGLRGVVMNLIWPDEYAAKVVKARRNWNGMPHLWWPHEFHLDGNVVCTHLGKSELRQFATDPLALEWQGDIRHYLQTAGVTLD